MKYILVLICLFFFTLFASAQNKKGKNESIQSSLVGKWLVNEAIMKDKQMGDVRIDDWGIEAIHFFKDSTVAIFGPKNEDGELIETSGVWGISDNGKVLSIKNRKASHTEEQTLKDIEFPIKLTTKSLRISFPMDIKYPAGYGLKEGVMSSKVWVYYIKEE
ncbi:hypothetical protein QWY31_05290 [Cytophagales bacterium LB-30]|uniref:Lipocalin-like domain-containing protein n=1 Tax=Shiella aurantiaca TaxID=3058365 RepID=A0ABT8F3T2_9BACT|nr:hypothetical protein [Shiella aurantiaca]MDN4164904.1 hypothetical protein [Shiella aurantiaca]